MYGRYNIKINKKEDVKRCIYIYIYIYIYIHIPLSTVRRSVVTEVFVNAAKIKKSESEKVKQVTGSVI